MYGSLRLEAPSPSEEIMVWIVNIQSLLHEACSAPKSKAVTKCHFFQSVFFGQGNTVMAVLECVLFPSLIYFSYTLCQNCCSGGVWEIVVILICKRWGWGKR
jgi:hypothetical protein